MRKVVVQCIWNRCTCVRTALHQVAVIFIVVTDKIRVNNNNELFCYIFSKFSFSVNATWTTTDWWKQSNQMGHYFLSFLNHLSNITSQPVNSSSAIISCEDSFVSSGNLQIGPFIREIVKNHLIIEDIKLQFSLDKAT